MQVLPELSSRTSIKFNQVDALQSHKCQRHEPPPKIAESNQESNQRINFP